MNNRPKIKLHLSATDKIIEYFSWASLVAMWLYTFANLFTLPEVIPTRYNSVGEAISFGNRTTLITLPIISTILLIGFTALNTIPHNFNYLVEITEDNALQQYTNATRLVRVLKLIIVLIFSAIVFSTIQNANEPSKNLSVWFLPLVIVSIFIPICYYWLNVSRKSKIG